MPVIASIRFLTGRAHLHPWDTHHSEGRIDWPPAPWRLLRALVAVAGRGLTSLPCWHDTPPERQAPEVPFVAPRAPSKRGVPKDARGKLSFSRPRALLTLKEPLSDAEAAAWIAANPSAEFAAALNELRRIVSLPDPVALRDIGGDEILLSRLASLLAALAAPPEIWLPRTSIGHTRHFFTIHEGGVTKTTGSAVFDTFAVVERTQPLFLVWPRPDLSWQQEADLRLLLARLPYFGRAESWCLAELCDRVVPGFDCRTHWRCVCWEDASEDDRRSLGREHRDFTLERRLAASPLDEDGAAASLRAEARRLFRSAVKLRNEALQRFTMSLARESDDLLLLRCLLRESGEDMKDGFERPIGTRWVHYAVPREIFNLPPRPQRRTAPIREEVHVVRYVLNTATVHRPVLPRLTDALLIGEKFRAALMSIHGTPSESFSGKDANGNRLSGHQHAFFLPEDEDEDGFIDHVTVWCPRGFTARELRALRSLVRLRQRGGRPDLLITPARVAHADQCTDLPLFRRAHRFVSRTPYVPPRHAYRGSGQVREAEAPAAQLCRELLERFSNVLSREQLSIVTVSPLTASHPVAGGGHIERCAHIPLRKVQSMRCVSFVQHRRTKERRDGRLHHGQTGAAWIIQFPEPVCGPIALGYGAHFGLGQFVPDGGR